MSSERKIDRFDKYMKIKQLNDNKVTVDLGLSVGVIGKSRKDGRDLSDKTIENILNFYGDLNRVWLLTGEGEMLKNSEEMQGVAKPIAVVGSGNAFSGMTDQEIEDFLAAEFNKRLLEMYETGRAAPAMEVRRYQQRIEELSAQVAKLEYVNQELTLKLAAGKTEQKSEAEHEKRASK